MTIQLVKIQRDETLLFAFIFLMPNLWSGSCVAF
ncbi:hypothetical protein EDB59_0843 [Vibrio crassostreae]|nr:hypothetical protein EDB59_0843 [Vibrio crassostreae]